MRGASLLLALAFALPVSADEGAPPVARPQVQAPDGAVPIVVQGRPLSRPEPAGPVCDADTLVGVRLPEITAPGGCGIASPVELQSAAGVALDPPAVVSCAAARALGAWLVTDVKPAVAAAGDRLVALDIAATYACRGRNNQPGAKLSEHGLGRAIDVAAFRLADGSGVAVEPAAPPLVTTARNGACGLFGTVLGPGSDAFHETHLHLDVAERRHGPYCR